MLMMCGVGRGDSTTRTGAGEAAQGPRTAERPARVIRGESTQASPGGDQRAQRSDRTAQQAPQQVCRPAGPSRLADATL